VVLITGGIPEHPTVAEAEPVKEVAGEGDENDAVRRAS